MTRPRRITLAIILEHLRAMEARMNGRFAEMARDFVLVRKDIADLRSDLSSETRMRRMQVENIDDRVTDIEIKRLPRLEKKVFS